MKTRLVIGAMVLALAACTSVSQEPVHVGYGKVISVYPHQMVEQQPNLVGAAIGGVAGGVLGHQFGKGNGKTAMTVLGAVAGATAGSQYNQQQTVKQVSDLAVQMADGQVFTITTQEVGFQRGQKVKIVQQGRQARIEVIKD